MNRRRNYNPRLAVAVARLLNSPVEFEFASPFSPGQRERFLKLNPNQSVPILVEGDTTLWEADAIACRLSQLANCRLLADGRRPARGDPLDQLGLLEFRPRLRSGPFRARDEATIRHRPGNAGSSGIGAERICVVGGHSGAASQRGGLATGHMQGCEPFEEEPAEETRQHPHGQEEAGLAGEPSRTVRR